jgi:hypothetical protein
MIGTRPIRSDSRPQCARGQEEQQRRRAKDRADLELAQARAAAEQAERGKHRRIAQRGREDGEQDDRRGHRRSVGETRAAAK